MTDTQKKMAPAPQLSVEQMRLALDEHNQRQAAYAGAIPNQSYGAPAPIRVAPEPSAFEGYLQTSLGSPRTPTLPFGNVPAVVAAAATPTPVAGMPGQSTAPEAPPLGAAAVPTGAPGEEINPLQPQLMTGYNTEMLQAQDANQQMTDAMELGSYGAEAQAQGEMDLNNAKAAEAREQLPIDKEEEDIAARSQQQMADIQAQGEKAAKAQMMRVEAAANDAANAHVRDFWEDKSTGGRIMGVLSQALAGAANGLAGNPSAPTPLDRIIDRDVRSQIENMQNKRAAVGNEQSTLRLVYEQTGNRMATQSAMTIAAYRRTKAMSQTLADKYATPKAQAENQKIQGVLEQKEAALVSNTQKFFSEQHTASAMSILGKITSLDNADTAAQARMAVKSGSGGEPAPAGTMTTPGSKLDKTVYAAVQKETHGIVSFLVNSDKAEYLWNQPANMENFASFKTTMSLMLTDTRQFEGTGAALSPAEEANMRQMLVKYESGIMPLPDEIWAAKHAIERVQAAATRMYVGRLTGALGRLGGPGAKVQLNPNDPSIGRHIANFMTEEATVREAQK